MKNLLDLCRDYSVPIYQDGDYWYGPCLWSFDETHSLRIDVEADRWEDWIMGFSGGLLDFVELVQARLAHLGRNRFAAGDWYSIAAEEPTF
jgi:hypothetical protein